MDNLREILTGLQNGTADLDDTVKKLRDLPYIDMGHTKMDMHRPLRNGFPEVIYAEGKTPGQVADIFKAMSGRSNVLATRVSGECAAAVASVCPEAVYDELGKTLALKINEIHYAEKETVIITAGTSDLPVAQEAKTTCDMIGVRAKIISDVGVAGLHRLFDRLDDIRNAGVVIVVAGMEGALASVIGGLVTSPVIAVPTSVGYGASFSGVSALLAMLTSCAGGITVMNIDNGFGAACAARRIYSLIKS
ncbi:MAG: nickel pincer cofactor biosynthesis protein LarB [Deferribacterales bacterium]